MKAVVVPSPGGPEAMEWTEAGPLVPKGAEVLISVAAAGVNRADILQRAGHYPPPHGASSVLGLECSGHILALGEDVMGWDVGDAVCALLTGGGYAEQAIADVDLLLPVPDGLSLVDAAALPEAVCTVWSNLVRAAKLQSGETLLVHGGGGGIGTAAVQIARARGARVAVTAGSAAKLEAARKLGADILINYKEEDFVDRMKAEGGADVILDIVGAKYLGRNVDVLREGGRLVIIGLQGGRTGQLDLAQLLMKQGRIITSSLRALSTRHKAAIVADVWANIWPLIEEGTYRPVIDRVMPISEVAGAHQLMENGKVTGKIVLKMPHPRPETSASPLAYWHNGQLR